MFIQTSQKRELLAHTLRKVFLGVFAVIVISGAWLSVATGKTAAATNSTLNFQAKLETSSGAIAADGNYNVEFKLYNTLTSSGSSQGSCTGDASCLWTETRTGANVVHVANGYLTVNLGSVTAFPTTINWDQQLYLTMNIGGTSGSPTWDGEMNPRLQLTGVPYAFKAGQLAQYNAATTFTSTLSLQSPTVGNQNFVVPDQAAAGTYNLCIQGSSSCGFAASTGSGSYIDNQTSLQSGANFNIDGTGKAANFNATTALQTGGTTRIDASGNLSNIGNIAGTGTLQLSGTTGTSYIMTSLGLGITNPQSGSALTVANSSWISSLDSAGTGYVNMFQVNSNNEIQVGAALNIDGGIVLPTDGGQLTFSDLPVDNSASSGTQESYTMRVGTTNALTIYGEADGSGGIQNVRVAVGSGINPQYPLDVSGDINSSTGYRIAGVAGITTPTPCGTGYYLDNQTVSGGITTGGTCTPLPSGSGGTPGGPAGGDLAGTYPDPTIASLQGGTLTITTPISGQVLQYDGSAWVNATPSAGFGGSGTVGTIALFTGTGSSVGDSILTQSSGTVTAAGNVIIQGGSSTSVFKVTNGANSMFSVDNTNQRVVIGTGALNVDTSNNSVGIGGSTVAGVKLDVASSGVGIRINGTGTANLLELQHSGSTVAGFDQNGNLTAPTVYANTLTAGTALQAPLLDTASAVALNLGTTNATSINLNQNTTIASGKTLTVNGSGFDASGNLGIGTTGPSANLDIQSAATTGSGLNITSDSLTSGDALNVNVNSASVSSGNVANLVQGGTYTDASPNLSGSLLNASRSITANNSMGGSVSFDQAAYAESSAASPMTFAAAVASHNNRYLVVAVYSSCTVIGASYNGVTMSNLGSTVGNILSLWGLAAPTVGTYNVVVTALGGCSSPFFLVSASSWYNVSQGSPVGTVSTNSGSSSTASITATTQSAQTVLGVIGEPFSSSAGEGSGQTQIYKQYSSGLDKTVAGAYKSATGTSTTMTWSSSNATWRTGAIPLNPAQFVISGSVANLSSDCTITAGSCADSSSILNLNQQYAGATGAVLNVQNAGTGDMLDLTNGSGVVLAKFDSAGNLTVPTVNAIGGYSYNGTAGVSPDCSTGGQVLANIKVQGGIVTSGSCAANGGGIAPTLQDAYNNSGSANPQIQLSSANGGIKIRDASTTVGNILQIQDNAGTTTYFAVTANGLQAASLDTVSAGALNIGTSNATNISVGSASSTSTLTLGQSTQNNTINIGNAAIASSKLQTINIGTGATSGGFENITIGTANSASVVLAQGAVVTLNGLNGISLKSNNASQGTTVQSNTNSSVAFQVQNATSNSVLNVDTVNGIVTTKDLNVGNSADTSGSRLFSDGFESGNMDLWSKGTNVGAGSTATISTSTVRNGVYSLKISPSNSQAYISTAINGGTDVKVRGYVYIASNSVGDMDIMSLYAGSNEFDLYQDNTTGKLSFWKGTSTPNRNVGSAVMSNGAWHEVEIDLTINASTGSANLYLDGTNVLSLTNINTGSIPIDTLAAGEVDVSSTTGVEYLDDITVATVRPGDSASLNVNDSLHVGGTSNFGNSVLIQNTAGSSLFTADTASMRVSIGSLGTPTGQLYVSGIVPGAATGSLAVPASSSGDSVAVAGKYAYATSFKSGDSYLQVIDISNPASPAQVGETDAGTNPAKKVVVQGHYAYLVGSGSSSTFNVVDVSDPTNPTSVFHVNIGTFIEDIYVSGHYAYLLSKTVLYAYDISNPAAPVLLNGSGLSLGSTTNALGLDGQGRYLYVATNSNSLLYIIDVSNPGSPAIVNTGGTALGNNGNSIAVSGRYAYVVNASSNKFQVFDLSTPTTPTSTYTSSTGISGNPIAISIQGKRAYIIDDSGALDVFDISNPRTPNSLGSATTAASPNDMVVAGRYAYVMTPSSLQIFDLGGAYVQQLEAGGIQTGSLQVNDNANFAGDASIQGGLQIGQSLQVGSNLSVNGNINSVTGYSYNGVAGSSPDCSTGGQVLANIKVQGGIITSGSCAANGGGVAPTLQDAYTNSGTTNPQIQLSATNGGLKIRDAGSTVGNILQVQDSTGASTYFAVTSSGVTTPQIKHTGSGGDSFLLFGNNNGTQLYDPNEIDLYGSKVGIGLTVPTAGYQLDVVGDINTSTTYRVGGTAGLSSLTCGAGNYIDGATVKGGVVTGGTCVAVPTGGGGGVTLQAGTPGTPDTGNFNISGTGIAGTALQTPILQSAAATALTITGNAASTFSTSAGNLTLQAGSGTVSLGSSTALTSTGVLTVTGGTTLTLSSTTTNAVTIDSGTTGAINIGTNTGAKTISIGTGATGVKTIAIGGTASNVITIGNTQTAGSISLGAAMTTGTISLGGASQTGTTTLGQSTQTNIVNIANGATASTKTQTVNIATGAVSGGVDTVKVGSLIGTSSTTLQGGTGATAISIQAGAAGTINVGTVSNNNVNVGTAAVAGNITIGGTTQTGTITLGQSTQSNTINIGNAAVASGQTQTINIGTGTTNGTTNIAIGSNTATTGTTGIAGGNAVAIVSNNIVEIGTASATGGTIVQTLANSATGFQIQNSSGNSGVLLNADTTKMQISIGNLGTPTGQLYVGGNLPSAAVGAANLGGTLSGRSIAVAGHYAYVLSNDTNNTLQSYDITNPASPVLVGTLATNNIANKKIVISGHYAYTVSGTHLSIIDISDPSLPATAVVYNNNTIGSDLRDVYVSGRYAFVLDYTNSGRITVFDVSNPANPVIVTTVNTISTADAMTGQGRYLYVASYSGAHLYIFDISNPATSMATPVFDGTTTTPLTNNIVSLAVSGPYLYAGAVSAARLQIINVSIPGTPTAPYPVVNTGMTGAVESITISGKRLYVTDYTNTTGANGQVDTFDISNPTAPSGLGSFTTGTYDSNGQNPLFVSGRYAYVVTATQFLAYDLGGTYTQQLEAGGLQTGTLSVDNNANFAGNTSIQGGLTVGQSLQVTGNVGMSGQVLLQNTTNSASAFQVQNATGTTVVNVDTTPDSTNLVTNGSFEQNTTGWAPLGAASISQYTASGFSGTKGLDISATAAIGDGAKYPVSLAANTTYVMSFYINNDTGVLSTLQFGRNENGSNLDCNSGFSSTAGRWSEALCSFTTGATIGATPYIYIDQTDATARHMYIDAVRLQIKGDGFPSPYREAGITLNGVITSPVAIQPTINSNTAFSVYDASGDSLFSIDAGTRRITMSVTNPSLPTRFLVGNGSSDATIGTYDVGTGDQMNLQNSSGTVFQVKNTGATTIQDVANPQLTLSQSASDYTQFQTDTNGNLSINTSGNTLTLSSAAAFSDQFSTSTLDPSWAYTDSLGQSFESLTANSGYLQLHVPTTTNTNGNDCWTGFTQCVRMMHNFSNIDNVFQTKIDNISSSNLTTGNGSGGYGILVMHDTNNYMRFEFHSNNSTIKASIYDITGGTGNADSSVSFTMGLCNYMQVTKTGTTYTLQVAKDNPGSGLRADCTTSPSWTTVGSVVMSTSLTSAGVYADNSGASTGYNLFANFDYFTSTAGGSSNLNVTGTTTTAGLNDKVTSSTAFLIQSASGVALLTADTSSTGVITIGNSGNTITLSAGGITLAGTARHAKTIVLMPEYANAVLDASQDGTCSSASTGTMTSGYDGTENFYQWTTSTVTPSQCYDVVVKVPIPSDFDWWDLTTAPTIDTNTSSTTNATAVVTLTDTAGATVTGYSAVTVSSGTTANSWQTYNGTLMSSGTFTPGGIATLKIRMTSLNSATIKVGTITLHYMSKY